MSPAPTRPHYPSYHSPQAPLSTVMANATVYNPDAAAKTSQYDPYVLFLAFLPLILFFLALLIWRCSRQSNIPAPRRFVAYRAQNGVALVRR